MLSGNRSEIQNMLKLELMKFNYSGVKWYKWKILKKSDYHLFLSKKFSEYFPYKFHF